MEDKLKIRQLKKQIAGCNSDISEILDKHLGEDEGQFHRVGYWECSKSPVGLCVYNPSLDRSLDDCIYCHGPHERK